MLEDNLLEDNLLEDNLLLDATPAPPPHPPSEGTSNTLPGGAFRDHLTQIGNRRYFEEHLDDLLRSRVSGSDPLTVLLLDLDRFKAVNDSLGHAVGDALLKLVAARMTDAVKPGDIMARLGGDEFGIVIRSGSDGKDLATRLVDLVQRTYLVEGNPINIGVSIGIASAPTDGNDRASLLKSADLALYQAKRTGRSCFAHFEPAMAVRASLRREMELDLRKALPLRQFEIYYRPQVDVQTKTLRGLEAMLQWRHPKHGLLAAPAFVPMAEEIGLINRIGEWVLKAVCREAAQWPPNVTIAASVSPMQFENGQFFEVVKKALEGSKITGDRIELTVTESILLRDGKAVLATLHNLRSLRVKVAIDSFGTGIASLSQMVEFPLDTIRIDRSLVRENGTGTKERAIVRAIAALGASLGISTSVEGVNTTEHLARIQMDGCSSVQGYLHSEAVPSSELNGLVENLKRFPQPFPPEEVLS